MRIRTQFALWVVGITLIPILLVGVGWTLFAFQKNQDPIPLYQDLPADTGGLTDKQSWEKIRKLLENRPPRSQTFVFTDTSRLVYSSIPVPELPPGAHLSVDEVVANLRTPSHTDIFLFKQAESHLWIVLTQDSPNNPDDFFQNLLIFSGSGLLVMLLFAITVAIVLGRALTMSIIGLEKAARKVADGDLDFPITVKGSDEIKSLGVALEQMRVALRQENVRQSRFVMGVSHDLKSPLTLIKGYAELLRDGPATDQVSRAAHFGLILDKVDQLDGMIDHLIDYSKTNTGEWQATWSEIRLKAFLEAFVRETAPDAKLLGRTLESTIDIPEDLTVTCDPRSIRRCLENLVNNALRYTPTGGRVGVSAKEIPGATEVAVWDDGPGIAPEDLPHLFELFYRGTRSRREPGMGLGLSIVKTILDSHGWTIRAESSKGSRFSVKIPRLNRQPQD